MKCSDCGEEILGSVVLLKDGDPFPEEEISWGELATYDSTEGLFVMLHPNCFKKYQDELFRQERSAVLLVAFGKVEDVKEALQIP